MVVAVPPARTLDLGICDWIVEPLGRGISMQYNLQSTQQAQQQFRRPSTTGQRQAGNPIGEILQPGDCRRLRGAITKWTRGLRYRSGTTQTEDHNNAVASVR